MKVLFFGTSAFAVPTLQAIHDAGFRHRVVGVVTQPDRPSGRGMKLAMTPVKELALHLGYDVYQPEKVRRSPFLEVVRNLAPDVLVVVSFGQIIPQKMLDIPRYGGVNVHASLLPRWRGAAPIHHAILAGDAETGVATMQMEATLDTGPVYQEERLPITPQDTVTTLEPILAEMGARLLITTLDGLESGDIISTPQSVDGMTYASPVTREMGMLDPERESATEMLRRIRAFTPRPGAFIGVGGKTLKTLDARIENTQSDSPPGTIIAILKEGIALAAREDVLILTRIQPENKGAMSAADYARGARLEAGMKALSLSENNRDADA